MGQVKLIELWSKQAWHNARAEAASAAQRANIARAFDELDGVR